MQLGVPSRTFHDAIDCCQLSRNCWLAIEIEAPLQSLDHRASNRAVSQFDIADIPR